MIFVVKDDILPTNETTLLTSASSNHKNITQQMSQYC